MSRSIHLNKCKRGKNYLLQLLGASSTSSSLSYRVLMALARMWLRRNMIHQIQDRYLFCSSYSESWMWASSSFELVRFSPRAPWGIKDEYRACYNNVTCHEHFHESWPALWQSRRNHDQSCSEPQPPGISCQHLACWKQSFNRHFSKKNSQPTNLAYKKYTLAWQDLRLSRISL